MDAALATATLPKVPHYKAEPSGELSCMLQTLADNAQERSRIGRRDFTIF